MQVYLLKDIEKIGMAGTILKVSDGYAANFLIPNKLAVKVNEGDIDTFKQKIKKVEEFKTVLTSKIAMLAEHIKTTHLTLKERTHDDGKLYGAISADEIVTLLKEKNISINKKQVEFPKAIKAVGEHKIIIKLSSKLQPELTLKVCAKAE